MSSTNLQYIHKDSKTAWLSGLIGWVCPGAGHLYNRKVWRGLALGGAVWVMFAVGILLGGHLFPTAEQGTRQGTNALLQIPPTVANIGTGILYLICFAINIGFAEQASRLTYEYGNTLLLVAGLLNYLAALDAFDIGAKRKL